MPSHPAQSEEQTSFVKLAFVALHRESLLSIYSIVWQAAADRHPANEVPGPLWETISPPLAAQSVKVAERQALRIVHRSQSLPRRNFGTKCYKWSGEEKTETVCRRSNLLLYFVSILLRIFLHPPPGKVQAESPCTFPTQGMSGHYVCTQPRTACKLETQMPHLCHGLVCLHSHS